MKILDDIVINKTSTAVDVSFQWDQFYERNPWSTVSVKNIVNDILTVII
jgi:ABC-type uncharacterized transport system involved in gliding motility auxiliary subunit